MSGEELFEVAAARFEQRLGDRGRPVAESHRPDPETTERPDAVRTVGMHGKSAQVAELVG